jgi:hypothetical protein
MVKEYKDGKGIICGFRQNGQEMRLKPILMGKVGKTGHNHKAIIIGGAI